MKKAALLIIAIFAAAFLQAQQPFTQEQQKIQQTVVKMFDALSDRDSVSLKQYCAPGITFYEYGQIWNLDTMINKAITMNLAPKFKRTNKFEFISTENDKNTAWITYRLTSVIALDGKQSIVHWLETVGLTKVKKEWKVKHLHSTLIKRS
jgi:type II secretory pathway pseudopilin PulG